MNIGGSFTGSIPTAGALRFIGFQEYIFISLMHHYILPIIMCLSLESSLNVVSIVIKLMFMDVLTIKYSRLITIDSMNTDCFDIICNV